MARRRQQGVARGWDNPLAQWGSKREGGSVGVYWAISNGGEGATYRMGLFDGFDACIVAEFT